MLLFFKVRNYCPHHVSHYLGMDVHDCTTASKDLELTPGMVITLEPGVYVAPQENPGRDRTPGVRDEFRGLGIRIEDDVLITESGFEILTDKCPRTVEEVENTCLNDDVSSDDSNGENNDKNERSSCSKGISV